jgi:uncharacterized protein (DUF2384 family)
VACGAARHTDANQQQLPARGICLRLLAYVAMLLWGCVFASLTQTTLRTLLPNVLLAMITGGFYVYHLDNVETESRAARISEAGRQAVLTGIVGLVAVAASLGMIFEPRLMVDHLVLKYVIVTIIGLSLGWYIPEIAAIENLRHPLNSNARRVQALETAAAARFGTAAAADQWLDAPHPALGGKSPRAAAGAVDGHQPAMALLRGPQEIAA